MNKTIYLTFDDATRLIDKCKGSDGAITREFFDWYLGEPRFFAETGILVVDNLLSDKIRVAVSFDFSNPDAATFTTYRYSDQKVICKFRFNRQSNLTMNNIEVEILEFYPDVMSGKGQKVWFSPEVQERFNKISDEIARQEVKRRMQKMRKTSRHILVEMAMKSAMIEVNKFNCRTMVYFVYALMYDASRQAPIELLATGQPDDVEIETETIKAIYRYSGYVDLTDNKIYRPVIKKDANEPTREYERHIQKWTVRGHYRRTAKGLIWIAEHTKGVGELEARVYGVTDESNVPVVQKTFVVERKRRKTGNGKQQIFSRFLQKIDAFFAHFKGFFTKQNPEKFDVHPK